MTRYTPLWQQAGTYPAAVDRGLLTTMWPATGFTGAKPTTVTNTMQVSIPAGAAAVALASGAGTELCRWDAAEIVTLSAAPPAGQSRVDVVVLQVRDNALDAGGNNDFIFQAIAGTPSTGTPAVPAVPNNAAAVCQLTVVGGSANLNGVTVTDRRRPVRPLSGGAAASGRVYQNAAQTIPGGLTIVSFAGVEWDTHAAWNTVLQAWVAPVDGVYLFTGRVEIDVGGYAGVIRMFLDLIGNGVVDIRRGDDSVVSVAPANEWSVSIATQVRLLAGDQTQLQVTLVGPAPRNTHPSIWQTYYEYAYLGP